MRGVPALLAAMAVLILPTSAAQPATPHTLVREAVVAVTISGLKAGTNEQVSATGTGFLISPDGLIATSYHIRANQGLIPGTEQYWVTRFLPGGVPSPPIRAEYFDDVSRNDVLFLQIPTFGWDAPYLRVEANPRPRVTATTDVYSSGFPPGTYLSSSGRVASYNGPQGSLWAWAVGMNFVPSLSGAPVYLADGHVVGLAKGSNTANPAVAYIVPSHLWSVQVVALSAMAQTESRYVLVFDQAQPNDPRRVLFEGRLTDAGEAIIPISPESRTARVMIGAASGMLEYSLTDLRREGAPITLTVGPNPNSSRLSPNAALFDASPR